MIPSNPVADAPATVVPINPLRGNRGRVQKQKQPRVSVAIKPQQFQTKKGLRSLYQKTKELKLDQNSQINVENTMKKIVVIMKTWHNEMVPKYSFDYFLQRCQVMGSHKLVSAYMAKVRRIHRGLDQWDEPDAVQQIHNNQNQNNEGHNQMVSQLDVLNIPERPARETIEQEQDDDDFMELMQQVEKKTKKKDELQQFNEPYVPEGYEPPFSEQDD